MGNDPWKGVRVAATVEKIGASWFSGGGSTFLRKKLEIGRGEAMGALRVGLGRFDLIGSNNALPHRLREGWARKSW